MYPVTTELVVASEIFGDAPDPQPGDHFLGVAVPSNGPFNCLLEGVTVLQIVATKVAQPVKIIGLPIVTASEV